MLVMAMLRSFIVDRKIRVEEKERCEKEIT